MVRVASRLFRRRQDDDSLSDLVPCTAPPARQAADRASVRFADLIHVDARTPHALYLAMQGFAARHPLARFVRRHRCFWSGFGIVKATNELVKALVESGCAFDRATLLSGSDYPIKPNVEIAAILARSGNAEFIEAFPMKAENRWSHMTGLYRAPDRTDRFHLRIRSRAYPLPWRRRLPYDYAAWGGSQWWTLTRAAVEHIAHVATDRPKLARFFANAFIPDECYFQTVLANSPFRDAIAGDDLRLSIWDRPEPPYPALLKPDDIDLLAASPKLFARKFCLDRHPDAYDLIDAELREPSSIRPDETA
jgi:hypothetical protein